MAWRVPTLRDIAGTLNQRELDLYRKLPDQESGADPVVDLMERSAEYARGFIRDGARRNRRIRMSPKRCELPESVLSKTMDYLAFDILKRIGVGMNEDRRKARDSAEEFFAKIANGDYTPEPYIGGGGGEEEEESGASEHPVPKFFLPRRKILDTRQI